MTDPDVAISDWHPAPKGWIRAALAHLTQRVNPAQLDGLAGDWTGRVDLADPNATTVLTLTDADGEYEIRFRPAVEYHPTV